MSRESWQPCWRHCGGSLGNPMSTSWPFWSLTLSSTCLRFICSRILFFFFLPRQRWNEHTSCGETDLLCWCCLSDKILMNYGVHKALSHIFSSDWVPRGGEPLTAEGLLWKETSTQPALRRCLPFYYSQQKWLFPSTFQENSPTPFPLTLLWLF